MAAREDGESIAPNQGWLGLYTWAGVQVCTQSWLQVDLSNGVSDITHLRFISRPDDKLETIGDGDH